MKKFVSALVLVGVAGASQAATLFDGLYADAAQTTLRTNWFAPNSFDAGFFLKGHYISSDFVAGASGSVSYVQFAYENVTNAVVDATVNVSIQVFDSVNPRNGEINYSGLAYPNAAGTAQAAPLYAVTVPVSVTAAAYGLGLGGFSLPGSFALAAGNAYGFAIRTDSAAIVPAGSYGTSFGVGSSYRNILHYDYGNSGTFSASGVYMPNTSVGASFALANAAPVPEPASMAVLGLGAAAMLRRRKRA